MIQIEFGEDKAVVRKHSLAGAIQASIPYGVDVPDLANVPFDQLTKLGALLTVAVGGLLLKDAEVALQAGRENLKDIMKTAIIVPEKNLLVPA